MTHPKRHGAIGRRLAASAALAWLGSAAALLCPGEARAAGFYLPGHGVKPMGRGGAFVASGGGDLNSLWHNPANLAGLESLTLTVDLALITLNFEFDRAPRTLQSGEQVRFQTVSNEAPPLPNPQILIGGKFERLNGLTWAAGLYAPYTAPLTFPVDGAQRYTLVDNNGSLLGYTHFAVAKQFGDALRLGAGVQNMLGRFTLVTVSSAYTGLYGDAEDPNQDLLTRLTLTDLFSPTGNFGAWIKLGPRVEAALSAQLPVSVRDPNAELEIRLPDDPLFAPAEVDGDRIDAGLKFPFMARVGVRLVLDRFDYEFAAVYENWGSVKEVRAVPQDVVVRDVPGVGSIEATPASVPLNYRDTFSVRQGAEFQLKPHVALRAGYTFESSAIPDEYYTVFLPDSTKHMFTLGGGYAFESWRVDASAAYFHMPDRTVTTSRARQINPTDPEGENSSIVGNGTYRQRFTMAGLAITRTF